MICKYTHEVHTNSPGGGVLCAFITTQILCDLSDAKFVKCAGFCVFAVFMCLFGLMHGNNSIGLDGSILEGSAAFTDTGPQIVSGIGSLTITWADPGDMFQGKVGGKPGHNEGWRFCIMYTMIAAYCVRARFAPNRVATRLSGRALVMCARLKLEPNSNPHASRWRAER